MKTAIFLLLIFISSLQIFANGVAVVNASNGTYLKLVLSDVKVQVENQVAVITTAQTFKNDLGYTTSFKYSFPMPEGASATQLRWFINGTWQTAIIDAQPQDTTLPGGGSIDPNLEDYLGDLPLNFEIEDEIAADSMVVIELTYVELLEYEFGNVFFNCNNDYLLIQTSPLEMQSFEFNLISGRTIEDIQLTSHSNSSVSNNGNAALVLYQIENAAADEDYKITYRLNSAELGLFSFSTFQPDTIVPDDLGNGFFTFVAEPDPVGATDIIEKVFTLIIDRSGSMSGNKIVQAKNAAQYIVNNLNDGDKFNIVDFESNVHNFRTTHVPFNISNRDAALSYISAIQASGGTNISGAFSTAIPQFSASTDLTANIIIFFTDGQATSGITYTPAILNHVQNLVNQNESDLIIFTFGIGGSVNEQLLNLLALQNNGIAEFLGNDELEVVITRFYQTIRNPVLLNTQIGFSDASINEIYPFPLPNLYKGQQMIVSGRYNNPGNVNLTLSGEAFGNPVQYEYTLNLADTAVQDYQFLPKIWAKQKIEHLLVEYYSYNQNSFQADSLKEMIMTISIQYGVITQFTSFQVGLTDVEDEINIEDELITKDFQLLGNYPNPFNPSTKIRFSVGKDFHDLVQIRIYNSIGQLIRVLLLDVNGKGMYEITWNGLLQNGEIAPSDMYIYVIDFGSTLLTGKMILIK